MVLHNHSSQKEKETAQCLRAGYIIDEGNKKMKLFTKQEKVAVKGTNKK